MAALSGRSVRIGYDSSGGGTYIDVAGARTDSMTWNIESIDITDKDDSGIRTLLDDIGTKSMDMTVEGVITEDTFLELANNSGSGTSLHKFQIDIGGIGTLAADYFVNSFEVSGADGAEAATFSMALSSSGAVTYTAA